MIQKIKTIAITGGTHGNELSGVYVVKKFLSNPRLLKRSNFETIVMHTNVGAIQKCTRYVDRDLNRTFKLQDLNNPELYAYEDILAKNINAKLGPKGAPNPRADFIVDLHSTTSNMGLSIIIDNQSPLVWQVAAYLSWHEPDVKIFKWQGDTDEVSFVNSISKNGFAIEVGPIPQGVLRADLFFATERLVSHLLDFFEKYNHDDLEILPRELEIYDHIKLVDFPRDAQGNITAMVHPNLEDQGYILIHTGDPLFVDFEGKIINYEEDHDVYAVFINEAAYYEKGFAMCFAEKKTINVSKKE